MAQFQGDTLSKIAAEKIKDRWNDPQYFPSDEEIFTVKTLGKNIKLKNIKFTNDKWDLNFFIHKDILLIS